MERTKKYTNSVEGNVCIQSIKTQANTFTTIFLEYVVILYYKEF